MFDCVTGYQLFSQHSLQASLSSHCIHHNSSVLLTASKMAHSVEPLTPFNYHQWKEYMEVLLRTKKLFRLTEETKAVPILNHDKEKYLIRLDKAHGYLFSSVSRDLRFHIQVLKTLRRFWTRFLPYLIRRMR